VDITDGIPKQLIMTFCRACERYLSPPAQWVTATLESKELLSLCLKKIRGLNKVKLIDAGFVWTEPHSRRIKVKLTIQKEVFTATILQQVFVVEFVVQTQQCDACARYESKDMWNAVVQLRQKVEHKKTFYFLEQLILKHNQHISCINVKETPEGLDFYYSQRSHALKFVEFLQAVVPIQYKTSERLISHDEQSNVSNYKFTFSVEITPICREDLVCLPPKLAASCGNISPLVICNKVSNILHVIDPFTLSTSEISPPVFWANAFRSIAGHKQLIEYTILDINPLGPINGKYALSDVTVARSRDFGSNDTVFYGKTHLGHLLKPGDIALGYDISTANFNDADLIAWRGRQLPDFMLVRKTYPERRSRHRKRHWRLKALEKEVDDDNRKTDPEKEARDMEDLMRDLEEDPELRSQVNLYKEKHAEKIVAHYTNDMLEEEQDFPDIGLEELIEDLTLEDDH